MYNSDDIYVHSSMGAWGAALMYGPGMAKLWRDTAGAVDAAVYATGAVVAGAPLAGEAATSSAGDLLFSKGTGLLNDNNFLRVGWGWYAANIIDFLPVGGEVFRVVVGSPSGPIHWHLWP